MEILAKRFGVKRLILSGIGYTDSFSIPAGHRITHVTAQTIADMDVTGSLSLGDSNAGIETSTFSVTSIQAAVPEVAVVTVTAAAVTQSGNITIAGETVAVVNPEDDTVAEVAAKIAAHSFTDWTVVQGTDANADKVTFTAKVAGAKTDIVFEDTGGTGVTASVNVTTQGVDAATAGDITVAGETVAITFGTRTPTAVATQIAAHDFSAWTVSRNGAVLTFVAQGEGEPRNAVEVALDTATGITFSSVTTSASTDHEEIAEATGISRVAGEVVDIPLTAGFAPVATAKTAYINLDRVELVNNVILYVGLEKYI